MSGPAKCQIVALAARVALLFWPGLLFAAELTEVPDEAQAQAQAQAQAAVAQHGTPLDKSEPVEVYIGPKMDQVVSPKFPKRAQVDGKEGWVRLHMMVDASGEPYEIAVGDSLGGKLFEKEAITTVEKWKFAPAHLDGAPLDAGFSAKITFRLRGPSTARSSFVRDYHRLIRQVNKGDEPRAAQLLAKLDPANLYEDAFYNPGRYSYAVKWGDDDTQLDALVRATAYETVEVLSGAGAELKLRCKNGFVFFRYQPELTYTVPDAKRSCNLEVLGDSGSKLQIAQY